MPGVIVAEELGKKYGDVTALESLSLDVPEGCVFGLLGPNGAGKTTVVRVLATLLRPDRGNAWVAGFHVAHEGERVRKALGLSGQYAAVDDALTGRENLEMTGRLYHLSRARVRARAAELIDGFGLSDAADRPVRTYSGGMRRRLDLAAAVVAEPSVLILDEPTTGLDPASRISLWNVIGDLARQGATVLLTTQYLEEADRLASALAVMDRGTVIARGTPDELKAAVGGARIEVVVADPSDRPAALAVLASQAGTQPDCHGDTGRMSVPVAGAQSLAEFVRAMDAAHVRLQDLALRRPTLDDVFLALTGHGPTDTHLGGSDAEGS